MACMCMCSMYSLLWLACVCNTEPDFLPPSDVTWLLAVEVSRPVMFCLGKEDIEVCSRCGQTFLFAVFGPPPITTHRRHI